MMKKLKIAIKHGNSFKCITLLSVTFKIKNYKKFYKEHFETLNYDQTYKILLGNGGIDFLRETFGEKNIEFDLITETFHSETGLFNYKFDCDLLLYANLMEAEFAPELYKVAE